MNYKYKIGMDEYVLTGNEHKQVVEFIHAKGGKGLLILRGGDLMFKVENIRSVNKTDHQVDGLDYSLPKLAPPPISETPEQRRERGRGWTKLSEWARKQSWWKDPNGKKK